MVDALAL